MQLQHKIPSQEFQRITIILNQVEAQVRMLDSKLNFVKGELLTKYKIDDL